MDSVASRLEALLEMKKEGYLRLRYRMDRIRRLQIEPGLERNRSLMCSDHTTGHCIVGQLFDFDTLLIVLVQQPVVFHERTMAKLLVPLIHNGRILRQLAAHNPVW